MATPRRMDRWRRRLIEYGAALVLTMALFAPATEGRPRPTFAVVRLLHRRGAMGFDPREVVASGVVLTVPIAGTQNGHVSTTPPMVSSN
ncbi:MAG: hypothetical protein M3Q03_15620 [Chloroflexota bacterium]|nr:hypothetical protein [Chloroflexota bacterium]